MPYVPGQWTVTCDVCGVNFLSSEVKRRWDNLIVCQKDWEPDHPQKYLRVRSDPRPVPFARDEVDDFTYVCYMYAAHPYADLAEADCAVVGRNIFTYAQCLELEGQT